MDALGPIIQSSPILIPFLCDAIKVCAAIATLEPIINGPSGALILQNELITEPLPIDKKEVSSTSDRGLTLHLNLSQHFNVTKNGGTKNLRKIVVTFIKVNCVQQ